MPPPIKLPFSGPKLRAMRERRGLQQNQLAELVGTGQDHVSRYETGKAKPSVATFAKFVKALDCEPDDLLDYAKAGAA